MSRSADALIHRATASGVGGIAVFEIYGPRAERLLASAFRGGRGADSGSGLDSELPATGRVALGRILDARDAPVDDVVVARLPPSASFCALEGWSVSCHGGPAVSDRVMRAFTDRGARAVSMRDLLRIARERDLIDVVAEEVTPLVVEARTARAARYFLRIANGELSARLRELLAKARGDESARHQALDELAALREDALAARRLVEPIRVLIAGRPNVGKSTLFNALFGRERVVVSERAGTTRDLVSELIEIDGYPVRLIDSAGLRSRAARDEVERLGIERARDAQADVVVFATDRDALDDDERSFISAREPDRTLVIRTKSDELASEVGDALSSARPLAVSALFGTGLDALRESIRRHWLGPKEGEDLPALPCTEALVSRARDLHRRWSDSSRAAAGEAFRECFPGCERPRKP